MVNSRDIEMLRYDVAKACRGVIEEAKKQGISVLITSTVRDDAYQAKLYAQGRTEKGNIVTYLKKPTFHWNKAGLAFDFCPVDEKGNCLWNRRDLFAQVGAIGKSFGLSWGGDWTDFVDMPHLEWRGMKCKVNGEDVRKGVRPELLANKEQEEVVAQKPHWAQKHYDSLLKKGIAIDETRFDDYGTRGELLAMIDKIVK